MHFSGNKLGGGIGTAASGGLLEIIDFSGKLDVQPDSCINMLYFMCLWLPIIFSLAIVIILLKMNVEEANERIKAEKTG